MGTHTYALLEVSRGAFDEIASKLKAADYHHSFDGNNDTGITLDMHGIGLTRAKAVEVPDTMRTTLQEARHLIQKRRDLAEAENAVREAGDCEQPSIVSMIVLTRMEIEEADDVLAEIDHALMAIAD